MLDGGDNNDYYTNIAQAFPNPDALAEFQFVTNNYSAEYGNAKEAWSMRWSVQEVTSFTEARSSFSGTRI